jgi:hypothetical protein
MHQLWYAPLWILLFAILLMKNLLNEWLEKLAFLFGVLEYYVSHTYFNHLLINQLIFGFIESLATQKCGFVELTFLAWNLVGSCQDFNSLDAIWIISSFLNMQGLHILELLYFLNCLPGVNNTVVYVAIV